MDANNAQRNENESQLDRIERKLDALLAALASEQDEEGPPERTLDGDAAGADRDQGQSLG